MSKPFVYKGWTFTYDPTAAMDARYTASRLGASVGTAMHASTINGLTALVDDHTDKGRIPPKVDPAPVPNRARVVVPLARTTDPHTSHEAAQEAVGLANNNRKLCLDALLTHGPMTGHEVAARLGVGFDKVHKRLPELKEAGLLEWRYRTDDPTRYVTRKSPSGRPCVVWYPTEGQS